MLRVGEAGWHRQVLLHQVLAAVLHLPVHRNKYLYPPPQRRRGDQDIRERGAAGRGRQAEQRRRGGGEAVRGGETEREGDRDLHRHQQGDEDIQGEDIKFVLTIVTGGRFSI